MIAFRHHKLQSNDKTYKHKHDVTLTGLPTLLLPSAMDSLLSIIEPLLSTIDTIDPACPWDKPLLKVRPLRLLEVL